MKYVKSGIFTTEQLSLSETINEANDTVMIATKVIENINDVSDDVKKELNMAVNNLNQAIDYLKHIKTKSDIALTFVPSDVQEREFL